MADTQAILNAINTRKTETIGNVNKYRNELLEANKKTNIHVVQLENELIKIKTENNKLRARLDEQGKKIEYFEKQIKAKKSHL